MSLRLIPLISSECCRPTGRFEPGYSVLAGPHHTAVPNAATRRWCHPDGSAKTLPTILNAGSAILTRFAREETDATTILRLQRPSLPFFTPAAPAKGMPEHWVDRSALYAGDTVRRIHSVVSAAEAVALLTPR